MAPKFSAQRCTPTRGPRSRPKSFQFVQKIQIDRATARKERAVPFPAAWRPIPSPHGPRSCGLRPPRAVPGRALHAGRRHHSWQQVLLLFLLANLLTPSRYRGGALGRPDQTREHGIFPRRLNYCIGRRRRQPPNRSRPGWHVRCVALSVHCPQIV
jgi:hypothetical protein